MKFAAWLFELLQIQAFLPSLNATDNLISSWYDKSQASSITNYLSRRGQLISQSSETSDKPRKGSTGVQNRKESIRKEQGSWKSNMLLSMRLAPIIRSMGNIMEDNLLTTSPLCSWRLTSPSMCATVVGEHAGALLKSSRQRHVHRPCVMSDER